MRPSCGKRCEKGFTLMEALLAAVVLAMAVTAIISPFTSGVLNDQADARRTLAVSLAQEMVEEILSKPFNDPQGASAVGPDPGEQGRSEFDNVDDYDGYEEPAGAIVNFADKVVADPAALGLSRHVTARYVYVSGQDVAADPTFVRVIVEMRYKGESIVSLTRLVCDFE